jgi:hypothetical protein
VSGDFFYDSASFSALHLSTYDRSMRDAPRFPFFTFWLWLRLALNPGPRFFKFGVGLAQVLED